MSCPQGFQVHHKGFQVTQDSFWIVSDSLFTPLPNMTWQDWGVALKDLGRLPSDIP